MISEWQNKNDTNELLKVGSDLGERIIKKIHSNPAKLLQDSNEKPFAYLFNLSNIPKVDNGKLINDIDSYASYRKVQKAYKLSQDNILAQIPLWVANCYEYADYTEREVIMKTADGGTEYLVDEGFLYQCFLWAGISQMNKCLSKENLRNEFCFSQNTLSDKILKNYHMTCDDEDLYYKWVDVLTLSKMAEEFNSEYTYGLSQIDNEINVKIGSGTFNKKGQEIMVPKYKDLDEKISILKEALKRYYLVEIKPKLFKYSLLK